MRIQESVKKESLLKAWFLAARPKTWAPSFVPILVASAYVGSMTEEGKPFLGWISGFACLSTLAIQIGTNLINDALDFKKGADTAERKGPRRLSQSGLIPWKRVWWGGMLTFGIALLLGVPLVLHGGWPIVILGLLSLWAGYAYTGGPYPLAYWGWGDFFVLLFFGWFAVAGMVYLHLVPLHWRAFPFLDVAVLGTQVGLLATVLIAINHFRDRETDQKVGKKTLSVRWGLSFVRWEILFCAFFPYVLSLYWLTQDKAGVAYRSWLMLPLSFWVYRPFLRELDASRTSGAELNSLLARSSLIQLLWGIGMSWGFVWSGR